MTDFQKQIKELVDEGLAVSEISKKLGHPMSSVSSVIKALKLKVRKNLNTNDLDHNFFDIINSEEKAYFLGFLIADGSISNGNKRSEGRISFLIQDTDRYILEKLKLCIKSKNTIYTKTNNKGAKNRKPQASFRWTSKHMTNTLKDRYGIISNKTANIGFSFNMDLIPDDLKGSFIRGFIDGDGSFESHKGIFTPSIVGTSKTWLTQVGDLVSQQTGLIYKIYENKGKTCNYYTLRWSADKVDKVDKIKRLYEFLYNNATIYLTRKRDKIASYLKYRANQIRVKGIWQCRA